METWLKILIWIIIALKVIPFILTQLLFCSCSFESEKRRLRKVWIPGTLLNLLGNGAAAWGATGLLLHAKNPLPVLEKIIRLRGTYQTVLQLAISLLICMGIGLIGGMILRALFFHGAGNGISRRRKAAVTVMALICAVPAILGVHIAFQSTNQIYISEISRKTEKAFLTVDEKEYVPSEAEHICYVTVTNPGMLDCDMSELWLSETSDELKRYGFQNVTIQAESRFSLAMDWEHGLDLKADNLNNVYLSSGSGRVISSIQVPGLREYESYALDPEIEGEWIILYQGKKMLLDEELPQPQFSAAAGFYEEGFDLSLSAPEGITIHYTLDGSDPLLSSPVYENPIRVEDRSSEPNVWSARTDTAASFTRQPDIYTVPSFPVDKCTIVRAVCADAQGHVSRSITMSYFVGMGQKTGYKNVGIVSIITDPDNLFGYERGIYVNGKRLTNWLADDLSNAELEWWQWKGNYRFKQERDAVVQFFDQDRNLQLSKEIGIQIKGGGSRSYLPRGLNLYARNCYDRNPVFDADFFGNGFTTGRLSLFSGGQEARVKIKDWMTARLLEGLDLDVTMNSFAQPYALFLDGEYWGNYWLTDTIDSSFICDRFGCREGNVIVIKNRKLKEGRDEDLKEYKNMVKAITNRDMTKAKNYKKACALIDMDNYLTFMAIEIYLANGDFGLGRNTALWRVREEENSEAGDGKWRWVLFDLNDRRTYSDKETNNVATWVEKNKMFQSLMENEEFSQGLYGKLKYLAEEVFTPERANPVVDEFWEIMGEAISLEHLRFYGTEFDKNRLTWIKDFFPARQEYILKLCEENLK